MLQGSGHTSDYVEHTGERRKAIGLICTYLGYLIVVDYLHVYAARDNNKTGDVVRFMQRNTCTFSSTVRQKEVYILPSHIKADGIGNKKLGLYRARFVLAS